MKSNRTEDRAHTTTAGRTTKNQLFDMLGGKSYPHCYNNKKNPSVLLGAMSFEIAPVSK